MYNASRKFARLWEFTHGRPYRFFGITKVVTQCGGGSEDTNSNNLVAPHTARGQVSFSASGGGWAEGLGGR